MPSHVVVLPVHSLTARIIAHFPWNVFQIGISGWFTGEYNIRCQPVDYSDSPSATRVSALCAGACIHFSTCPGPSSRYVINISLYRTIFAHPSIPNIPLPLPPLSPCDNEMCSRPLVRWGSRVCGNCAPEAQASCNLLDLGAHSFCSL